MSSRKKVIVRKFSRDWLSGYVEPQEFARQGQLELLDPNGKLTAVALREIKMVCFVREFLPNDRLRGRRAECAAGHGVRGWLIDEYSQAFPVRRRVCGEMVKPVTPFFP